MKIDREREREREMARADTLQVPQLIASLPAFYIYIVIRHLKRLRSLADYYRRQARRISKHD